MIHHVSNLQTALNSQIMFSERQEYNTDTIYHLRLCVSAKFLEQILSENGYCVHIIQT